MAEWEIDFKVPVEVEGEGYIYLRGYTAAEEGQDDPTPAQLASAEADAKEHFKEGQWTGSVATPGGLSGGLGEYEIDTVKPKWDKMEKAD